MNKEFSIKLTGDLTIKKASELQQKLIEAINGHDKIQVLIDDPENLDVTCLQLLQAAQQNAKAASKQFIIRANLSADLSDLLHKAGFNKFL